MIDKTELFEILQNWNLWSKDLDAGIERPIYLQELASLVERKEVLVLKGIRRCGKSTIMKQLMKRLIQQGVKKEQLLYVNLEDYRFEKSMQLKLLELILEVHKEKINAKDKIYFFIDEIQMMPLWERFIRTKYDLEEKLKFIVSGSNASLLSKELSSLLTGRNLTFEIKPLSFLEYKTFTLNPDLEEYLTYGGFPEVVLEKDGSKKKKLLGQYFEDIINKDVISRYRIRNPENVVSLAKYLLENSGTKFSINNISKALNMDNKTVENYISKMIDAYFLIKVNHFSYSAKKRFDKMIQPKYYLADTGFFMVQNMQFSKDRGKIFENAIAILLNEKNKELMYWKEITEVDFVTKIKAINVTIETKNIPKREFTGLIDFKKKHKTHESIIVVPTKSYEIQEEIEIISFEDFCKQ
jgi:uncharacterized protein